MHSIMSAKIGLDSIQTADYGKKTTGSDNPKTDKNIKGKKRKNKWAVLKCRDRTGSDIIG